jgi:hypothetical protein
MVEKQAENAEHVVVESLDKPHIRVTTVTVRLGHHHAVANVDHGSFLEWRMRRTIRKLKDRVFMLARQERDWCLVQAKSGSGATP